MKIKLIKIVATILILGGIVSLSVSCIGQSNAPTPTQTATVQRGNISIIVTGTGNLALENKQSLSFGQTGLVSNVETAKVSAVNVVEGQVVDESQVLVKADTKDWQNRITALQHQLDSAKANLVQVQTNVVNAQSNQVQAEYNLSAQQDVKAAQDKIDDANTRLQQAQVMFQEAALATSSMDPTYWLRVIADCRADIAKYQKDLQDLLDDPAVKGVSVSDIKTKELAVQQAQASVAQAQANVVIAQNAVDDAQTALNEEQNSPQVIVAPIKGLITKVNVNQGDIVQRNANLIEIADPDKFEANVLVTERDVTSVKMGGDATVSFDALPGLSFPAKITQIAPLATVQQGVVNYKVTVELTSTKPATGVAMSAANMSQVVLKDGFSAVVNIPVQKKDNILIVPSRAVTHQGQNYVVQVVAGTSTETRIVKIGITDYQNTEITDGLNQGDRVVLPSIPTSTPSNPGGLFGGPGG